MLFQLWETYSCGCPSTRHLTFWYDSYVPYMAYRPCVPLMAPMWATVFLWTIKDRTIMCHYTFCHNESKLFQCILLHGGFTWSCKQKTGPVYLHISYDGLAAYGSQNPLLILLTAYMLVAKGLNQQLSDNCTNIILSTCKEVCCIATMCTYTTDLCTILGFK